MKNAKTVKTHKQAPKSIDTGRHVVKAAKVSKNGKSQAPVKPVTFISPKEATRRATATIAKAIEDIILDAKEALKAVQAHKWNDAAAAMSRAEGDSDYVLGELEVIQA